MTPPGSPTAASDRLLLPPERFYWALLDGSIIRGRNGRLRSQLGYLFENVLPLPIEQVHAVYLRLPRTKQHVACGMGRETIQQEIQGNAGVLVHLGPAAMPEFLTEQLGEDTGVQLDRANLLDREFEPASIRRIRHRLHLFFMALLLASGTLCIVGLERRTAAANRHVGQLNETRWSVLNLVLPGPGGQKQPAELRLTAELRRLRQSRENPLSSEIDLQLEDCAPILAELLKHWPSDVFMLTESVSITPESISIRGSTPGSQDVQKLADSLGVLRGWQLQQPQVSSGGGGASGAGGGGKDGVQASLQFSREGRATRGGSS